MSAKTAAAKVSGPPAARTLPLVLDLDHTLLRTDLLVEKALVYLKANPFRIVTLLRWLAKGRAHLKRQLAQVIPLDRDSLPVNEELVAYAEAEHAAGRRIALATAGDMLSATHVAGRFAFIDRVIASDGETNVKGAAKARALTEAFPGGFVYAGDSRSDLAVWKEAGGIVLVGTGPSVTRTARKLGDVEAHFPRANGLKTFLKAARLHQWAKNSLIFVPLVLGGKALDPTAWLNASIAFLALGILASATYLINDLWDLDDDRRHWSKRNRPRARGRMAITTAITIVPVAFMASLALGAFAGPMVVAGLLAYLGLTLAYSFALKRKPVLDAFALAVLFTLRLVIGIAAVGVMTSPWLLVFSMFLFASLSFAKRQTEVQRMIDQGRDQGGKISGRGYFAKDMPFILATGISCGMAAVLIMVLYLTQEALIADFYGNSVWLWAMPPVLFLWLARIWMICQRGELDDDPVVFAIRDPKSLVLCGVIGAAFLAAWLGVPVG